MMQIHVNAIEKSRVGDIQYVLRKSLDMACVSEEKRLLEYLKDGWEIAGKYNNGVGYDSYRTTDEREIFCIKNFIEKELLGFEIESASSVTISFQEFFAPITCKSKEVRGFITFYNTVDGKLEHENFRFYDDNANRIKDLIFGLNMEQDKATVIDLIEKKMKLESEGK